jgi:peptidylprolyl isomerase
MRSDFLAMKQIILAILLVAAAGAASGQTKPKAPTATGAAAKTTTAAASGVKLPPGVPPARGVVKSAFSLRYQDIKIGAGADAQPNQIYKVLYTGWVASDGHKFDSSEDHRQPVMGPDGKPVLGADGKPKLGDPQPISFPQGFGRVIPGFDQGFDGMKIGGKRRLFIPWQLAYGAHGRPGPDPAHPGIPPKADLIFDIELVDVTELQMPAGHPGMTPMRPGAAMPPGHPPTPGSPGSPSQPAPAAQPSTPAQPATQPTQPATPPQQPQH